MIPRTENNHQAVRIRPPHARDATLPTGQGPRTRNTFLDLASYILS